MTVDPNSQRYDDDKAQEALLLGDAQKAASSLSKFARYSKKHRVLDLPFPFQDMDAVDKFQSSGLGRNLLHAMRGQGLRGLTFWRNGMKQMSAKRPLIAPGDAAGLKFRTQQSDPLQARFEQLGANPQKMAFKEVCGQGGLRRVADRRRGRAGKHLVEHLRQETLRGAGRCHRTRPAFPAGR